MFFYTHTHTHTPVAAPMEMSQEGQDVCKCPELRREDSLSLGPRGENGLLDKIISPGLSSLLLCVLHLTLNKFLIVQAENL